MKMVAECVVSIGQGEGSQRAKGMKIRERTRESITAIARSFPIYLTFSIHSDPSQPVIIWQTKTNTFVFHSLREKSGTEFFRHNGYVVLTPIRIRGTQFPGPVPAKSRDGIKTEWR